MTKQVKASHGVYESKPFPHDFASLTSKEAKLINYDEERRLSLKKEKSAFEQALALLGCLSLHHHKTDSEDESSSDEDCETERKSQRESLSTRDIQNSIVLAFILTIRASIRVNKELEINSDDEEEDPEDYEKINSFFILPVGESDRLLVKEYAAKVFKKFRKQTVPSEFFLWSWSQSTLKDPVRTCGHSDSSFIYSCDNRFIIKTLTTHEAKWLLKILPNYCEYIKCHKQSLLTRYLGLYRLSDIEKNHIHFTVFPNIFESKHMDEVYDLKGSTRMKKRCDPDAPLLDRDLKRKFRIGRQKKDKLMSQLRADVEFLAENNLMDYSLLIGVYNLNKDHLSDLHEESDASAPRMVYFLETKEGEEPVPHEPPSHESCDSILHTLKPSLKRSRFRENTTPLHRTDTPDPHHESYIISEDGKEAFFVGIIDYLQKYNSKKKLFHFAQCLTKDKEEISNVSPGFYSRRFIEFIDQLFI